MVQEVMAIISRLKAEGLSMLMVEQNIAMAMGVADRVYILSKGQVVFAGTPDELRANDEVKSQYLGMNH
jgi:branched-chain amino acid transport system ATP-binding protein